MEFFQCPPPPKEKIRVLIVDDHPMMRAALCGAVESAGDMEMVGEAVNGQQAVQFAFALKPDVIVMDLYMPMMDGVDATREIMAANTGTRVLVLTSSDEDNKVVEAIRAGASGYLMKDTGYTQLLQGIRELVKGHVYLPPVVVEKLARGVRGKGHETQTTGKSQRDLTPREQDVLHLMGEGLTNQEIAERLVINAATVRVHLFNLMDKLGLESRSQAIVYAVHHLKTYGK